MNTGKRIVSALLCACMLVTLLPAAAFAEGDDPPEAEGGKKAIVLVKDGEAANIKGKQVSNIYFGTYLQSGDEVNGYNVDPIKWRVLSTTPNGKQPPDTDEAYLDKENEELDADAYLNLDNWESGDGLFLLSDKLLDEEIFHSPNSDSNARQWAASALRKWMNNNFMTSFSPIEKGEIMKTAIETPANGGYDGGNPTRDQIFALSLAEAMNSDYGFSDDDARKGLPTEYASDSGLNSSDNYARWWLRSPGTFFQFSTAAYVSGSGTFPSLGYTVDASGCGARPAFNLDLTSVLFTSAAEGGKIPADGNGETDDAIFEIGDYAGSEWKLTLLDKERKFGISNVATDGNTIKFSYSDARTGPNEYISVVIEENGAITHYGRVSRLDDTENDASGEVSFLLPAGVTLSDTTKLYVFNEQYNGGEKDETKLTDYGSKMIDVLSDTTAPTLSNGSATRDSKTTATVKFTSSEAGKYYYEIVEKDAGEPTIDTSAAGTPCDTTEQTISLDNLTGAGAKDIYIVVKDAAGNVSRPLKITICAYAEPITPTYQISASARALNFDSKPEGYAAAPEPQEVTVTNTGNQWVTVPLPESETGDYIIAAKSGFTEGNAELAPRETAVFTVQPKIGLSKGAHEESLVINGTNGAEAKVDLSFTVTEASLPETHTLTVQLNGGSGKTTGGEYAEEEVIHIDAGEKAGFRFAGWTASKGGTFGDATKASTTFTMPAGDTTITANWEPVGSTGSGDTESGANPGDETASAGEAETAQKARKLTAPKKVTASPAYNKVKVSWKKVKGATGYQVYRSAKKNGKYKKVKTTKARTWTNRKLKTGKTYYYKVRAYKKEKGRTVCGKFSARKKAKVRPAAPALKVRASKGAITAKWSPVAGATRYQLYRASKKNGTYYRWRETVRKGYVDRKKLRKGKVYYYKARAYRVVNGTKIYGKFSEVRKVRAK